MVGHEPLNISNVKKLERPFLFGWVLNFVWVAKYKL